MGCGASAENQTAGTIERAQEEDLAMRRRSDILERRSSSICVRDAATLRRRESSQAMLVPAESSVMERVGP